MQTFVEFHERRLPHPCMHEDRKYLWSIVERLRSLPELLELKMSPEDENPNKESDDLYFFELSTALVELGEDLYVDLGLWRGVEQCQQELFKTPLPLFVKPGESISEKFDPRRIEYFLYVFMNMLKPNVILDDDCEEIKSASFAIANFLKKEFENVPTVIDLGHGSTMKFNLGAGSKEHLLSSGGFIFNIDSILTWLGTKSYLFRIPYKNYLEKLGKDRDSVNCEETNNFLFGGCSWWSGLSAIDILPYLMPLSENDLITVKSCAHLHITFYRVDTIEMTGRFGDRLKTMDVTNIINNQSYHVEVENSRCQYKKNTLLYGLLLPWRDKWYWSDNPKKCGDVSAEKLHDKKKKFLGNASNTIIYHCFPELEQKAKEMAKDMHSHFVSFYKSELATFPNGRSMAASEEKRMKEYLLLKENGVFQETLDRHVPFKLSHSINDSDNILKNENGVAVFSNPDDGQEIMPNFNDLLSAFRKKDEPLSKEEADAIDDFIRLPTISPTFVMYMVKQYGATAIGQIFLERDINDPLVLEYILRRYKGRFYRTRFPTISLQNVG